MSFDDNPSFGQAKMEDIGGRPLPPVVQGDDTSDETFGQAKIEGIGGRALPKADSGAVDSTLAPNDVGNVDKLGVFPN